MIGLAIALLAAAVAATYALRERLGGRWATGLLAVWLAGLLVAAGVLVVRVMNRGPVIVESMDSSPGYMLGRAIAEACPGGGTVVVFDLAPRSEAMTRIHAARMDGLRRGLGEGAFTVVEEVPNLSDNQLSSLAGSLLPPPPFLEAAGAHPGAVAMVSFVGLPRVRSPDAVDGLPPLYALATGSPALTRRFIEAGAVPAAVCYRPDANWTREPSPDDTPEAVFALYYILVTADNLADLEP